MTGRELVSLIEKHGLMDKQIVKDYGSEVVFKGEHHECNSVSNPDETLEYDEEIHVCLYTGRVYLSYD